jgi:hypothetical protein
LPGGVREYCQRGQDENRRLDIHNYFLEYNPGIDGFLFYKSIFKKGDQMKKWMLLLLLPFMLLNISGCFWFIVGGAAGAAGAVAISKDTMQGDTDKPYESLWNAAVGVSRIRGTIKQEDSISGYIELQADSNLVKIKLIKLTQATTRLRVSARNKLHFPNLGLAQDVYGKIMEEAR